MSLKYAKQYIVRVNEVILPQKSEYEKEFIYDAI